ncbi:MAG: DegT/DnrJ/EryC1/StrS family aminotransferase [Muribaculaceae bacterium]|nr:DegT/DnrJ/EryC1/StrS family aminotransferase [Muribaculaceae bacterium]
MIKFLDLKKVNDLYEPQLCHAIQCVVESGRYIGGEILEQFESLMKNVSGADYVVPTGNGLDALTLVLEGYKILGKLKVGDEVIVPANTYIATVLAVWRAGLKPIAVDADQLTMNIDFDKIEQAVTDRTKAVIVVHLYGKIAYDYSRLFELKKKYNLLVVEDCAQSIGAKVGKVCCGSLGDASAFSFYPTKNVGALGDGGAVATSETELADVIRALANYGSDRRYHNIYKGVNSRLDAIQAAVINLKLESINEIIARRIERAGLYDRLIENQEIIKPIFDNDGSNVYHQYVVRTKNRELFRAFLLEHGIETDCHYNVAAIDQPCCSGEFNGDYEVSREIAATCVSLPIGDHLDEGQCREIAQVVNLFRANK